MFGRANDNAASSVPDVKKALDDPNQWVRRRHERLFRG